MWKYSDELELFLCVNCLKIFESQNSKISLNLCAQCEKPICLKCVEKRNDFCSQCMTSELIISLCKDTTGIIDLTKIIN